MKRARWETEKYDPGTNFGYPKGMPSDLAGPGSDDEIEREEAEEREAIVREQEAPESATKFPFGSNVINIDDDENADWLHPKKAAPSRRGKNKGGGSMRHTKKATTTKKATAKKAAASTFRQNGPTLGILRLLARRKKGATTAQVHEAFPHTAKSDILTRLRRGGLIAKNGQLADPWAITAAGRAALAGATTKGGKR